MSPGTTPWTHRRWRNGICRPDLGGKTAMLWVMALLFGGVAGGIAWKAPHMLHFARVRWEVLIPGGFGLVGAIFLLAALVASTRWFRFGRCVLKLQTAPGVIGGHLRGELLVPAQFPEHTDVHLELYCETTTTTPGRNSDDMDHRSISRNWSRTIRMAVGRGGSGDGRGVVPFDFLVPYGLPDATASRQEGRGRVDVAWKLRAFARLHGPDLDLTYLVPVFATDASDPSVKDAPAGRQDLDAMLRDSGEQRRVRFEAIEGANVCVCDGRGRKSALAMVPLIIGVLFLGGATLVACNAVPALGADLFKKASGWDLLFKLVPLVFTLGACLMVVVLGGIGLLLAALGLKTFVARRTWVRHGAVQQRCSLLGIPWRRSLPCRDATDVRVGSSSGSGGKTWYDIVIACDRENEPRHRQVRGLFRQLTVATDVATEQESDDLIARLRREIGLPPPVNE